MPAIICEAPYVMDGDSIRCANLGEIRLLAIDAPDRRSSRPCKRGFGDHVCDDRAANQAKWTLREAVTLGPVRVTAVTTDRYGRTVATVTAGGRDLSCWQLRARTVRYIVRYDNGQRIARQCPAFAKPSR